MFEWTWDSVAAECTAFLGPAGYGYVQVSPPQEHIQGTQWWTDYQPVSYTLTSKRGNRTQFSNVITACHNAGVGVIVDTIWNHYDLRLRCRRRRDFLDTETEYVRGRLATYGNDLISLGADGLRLDAAKHIPAPDIANILSRLSKTVYITQEARISIPSLLLDPG
ncbi:hypothetical protein FRC04_006764 [Tulasnella sp. 424]|nr:hypothetical protein FRC04_006764 [Tulasnella sp. 424]